LLQLYVEIAAEECVNKEELILKKWLYKFQKKFARSLENDISYNMMQRMIKENSEVVVIDVRTRDEFGYNHLRGAINIPLQDICEEKVRRYVRNKLCVIIVYCEYGGRSKKAMNKLKKMGYENVYNLDGGIENI